VHITTLLYMHVIPELQQKKIKQNILYSKRKFEETYFSNLGVYEKKDTIRNSIIYLNNLILSYMSDISD